jgi:hypothetical protein
MKRALCVSSSAAAFAVAIAKDIVTVTIVTVAIVTAAVVTAPMIAFIQALLDRSRPPDALSGLGLTPIGRLV